MSGCGGVRGEIGEGFGGLDGQLALGVGIADGGGEGGDRNGVLVLEPAERTCGAKLGAQGRGAAELLGQRELRSVEIEVRERGEPGVDEDHVGLRIELGGEGISARVESCVQLGPRRLCAGSDPDWDGEVERGVVAVDGLGLLERNREGVRRVSLQEVVTWSLGTCGR